VEFQTRDEILLFNPVRDRLWGSPAIYLISTGFLSPGIKRPVRETLSSSPYSAYIRNVWSYTTIPRLLYGVDFDYSFFFTLALQPIQALAASMKLPVSLQKY
jgi:hypothetical protein